MINCEKRSVYSSQKYRRVYLRIRSALFATLDDWRKIACVLLSIALFLYTWYGRGVLYQSVGWFEYLCFSAYVVSFFAIFWMAYIAVIGYALHDYYQRRAFLRIGHVNKVGEPPILLSVKKLNGITTFTYESTGIPIEMWQDRIAELQNTLNFSISSIKLGRTAREIVLTGCRGFFNYNKEVYWHPIMQTYDDTIVLGELMGEPVVWDLNHIPHALIGGATGSGKSWLLKHILLQCINKEYQVTIADFKGGCDFSQSWQEYCTFVCNADATLDCLSEIWIELKRRQQLLFEKECPNIDTYNSRFEGESLKRMIFACDELAELLDTSGLNKEEKEILRKIEKYLNSIARLGRALGIHLILATQRPDADILNGQIKSNINYRICGRADSVLSRIILDNSDADKTIPKDAVGLFLNHEGQLFKGYVYDDFFDIYV